MSATLPPAGDTSGTMRSMGRTLLSLFCDRMEMVAIEFQEERQRAQQKLTVAVLAAVFLALGVQLAALLVIVLFWDTYRVPAALGVTALYLGIGFWAVAQFRHLIQGSPPLFAGTMDEFRNDVRLFSGEHD
jgi:uncharacterized membrane protein YqjE